mmetsp:Transcript_9411/g.22728  ORF Transcript_9411/g.22728 Transcript_9411/m.22728 type:complete len:256 (+) Transcript_9411:1-768(+)
MWLVRRRTAGLTHAVRTAPPHPSWSPGDKQPLPFDDRSHTALDPKKLASCYPLMISSFVPRPIAFVSSKSDRFGGNLAPFSYAGCFNHDPPTVAFSVVAKDAAEDGKKDTLANIDESGDFVVNIMSEWYVEAANHTCGAFARGVDEFDESGLTRLPSVVVGPPRVGEAAVAFECRLSHRHEMRNAQGKLTSTLILGEVVMVHVATALCEMEGAGPGKPTVKFDGYNPLARLGGNTYARTTSTFDLPRPDRNVRKV